MVSVRDREGVEKETGTIDIERCPLCGSESLNRLPFEYSYGGRSFPGRKCGECGLMFISPQPGRGMLEEMYDAAYFEADFRCGSAPAAYFEGEETFTEEAASVLKLIREVTGKTSGRLLEIGCAGGWLLKAARDSGWEVTGVEISAEAAEFARKKLGLDVFCGELAEAGFPSGSFDVVFLADVLEHVPDPVGFAGELRRVVAPDGRVIIAGPTALNALARRVGMFSYGLLNKTRVIELAPYHLFEYTLRTIRLLLETAGLEVTYLKRKKIPPSPGGRKLEDLVVFAVELVTYPMARLFGLWSDRVILCAAPRDKKG
jgi:2-polyprenyl-3-methyl-5-hydroxy-6-metoxy-1,4-benzoquinol methylase